CLRVLLEPLEQELAAALGTVAALESPLAGRAPRLLHGVDATAWALLREAARRGYDARIGLEDTLLIPEGRLAGDNSELVRAARTWIPGLMALNP
ncbi:MAG TPA: 3-keto-5-aminohexanoate cleavage protein, partial [Gemmatimonadales bacterium]